MPNSNISTTDEVQSATAGRVVRPYVVAALAVAAGMASSCAKVAPLDQDRRHTTAAYAFTVTDGPSLPAGRGSHAGGVVGGHVVIAGGSAWSEDHSVKHWLSDTLVFDAAAGVWIAGPPLPHACAEMAWAGDGEALYMAGGKNGGNTYADSFRITSVNGSMIIEPLPPLPNAVSGCAGAMLDGVFYVIGGFDSAGAMTDALWALDVRRPDSGWQRRAAMPAPTCVYPGLAAAGDALFLFGGCVVETPGNPIRQVFKSVHRYEPAADRWSRLTDLPSAGQCWVADALNDHTLIITGRGDTGVYDDIWLVDLRDSSVKGVGSLVTPSIGAPLVRVNDGHWWFIAGEPAVPKSRTPRVSEVRFSDVTPRVP